MTNRSTVLFCVVVIWILAAAQATVAPHFEILGSRPDFLLTFLGCMSLFLHRSGSGVLGFFCGLTYGCLSGVHLFACIFSRTVAGFLAPAGKRLGLEVTPLVVAATVFGVTIVAQLLWLFLAAPKGVLSFLGDTIRSAMYNGLLSVPLYALLRKFLRPASLTGL